MQVSYASDHNQSEIFPHFGGEKDEKMIEEPTQQINKEVETPTPSVGNPSTLEEIDFAPLLDYFGMDRPLLDEKNDLRYISTWIGKQGQEKGDQMLALKKLEIKLGFPPTGENRLKRIINYLKIDEQLGDLLKEQEAIRR